METKKQLSGGARLIQSGKKAVLLGLTQEQHATILAAAKAENRRITEFVTYHSLTAAKKISKNSKLAS